MKLIVGLGNFGKQYEHTRHNIGFDVVDIFANSLGVNIDNERFNSYFLKTKYFNEEIILQKPLTYMNNSGVAVKQIADYFKIENKDILIVYDDMDIEVGKIKLKENGSSAGHNGIKSIISFLKTEEFKRIRVGIGKPTINTIDFVLSKPGKEEKAIIDEAKEKAVLAIKEYLKENFDKAMTKFN